MRKSLQQAHRDHQKFLSKMGVRGTGSKYRVKIPDYKTEDGLPPTSNTIMKIPTKREMRTEEKIRMTQNYTIGQAYNKSGLQVISKADASDPATGKRRS